MANNRHERVTRRWARRLVALAALTGLVALASCGGDDENPAARDRRPRALEGFVRDDFAAADTNGDGRVDAAELRATIREDFDAMDLDVDGVVTIKDIEQEYAGFPEDRRPAEILPLAEQLPYDNDDDGAITFDEYRRHVEREIVRSMDADGDGTITKDELNDYYGF